MFVKLMVASAGGSAVEKGILTITLFDRSSRLSNGRLPRSGTFVKLQLTARIVVKAGKSQKVPRSLKRGLKLKTTVCKFGKLLRLRILTEIGLTKLLYDKSSVVN